MCDQERFPPALICPNGDTERINTCEASYHTQPVAIHAYKRRVIVGPRSGQSHACTNVVAIHPDILTPIGSTDTPDTPDYYHSDTVQKESIMRNMMVETTTARAHNKLIESTCLNCVKQYGTGDRGDNVTDAHRTNCSSEAVLFNIQKTERPNWNNYPFELGTTSVARNTQCSTTCIRSDELGAHQAYLNGSTRRKLRTN